MEWAKEGRSKHWRDIAHVFYPEGEDGPIYSLEYIWEGVPDTGWFLFMDDEEEGQRRSYSLAKSKEMVEELAGVQ